jgi:SAM-dependent methyltransferase
MSSATKSLRSARRDSDGMEPSLFYTGIVAELYAPLKAVTQDPEPYATFIGLAGEPALELGCGDGHPLLELRQRGIDIEGVDSSADMLDRCMRAASKLGVEVVVHHQKMESLDLERRYRSVFLAGPTFNLLPDDDTAARALTCIREHLDDGGSALIPLFIPPSMPKIELGQVREATEPDGSIIRVSAIAEERDEIKRTQETTMRYERLSDGISTLVDRVWVLHWHTQAAFRSLAASAGLTTAAVLDSEGRQATEDADVFVFWLNAR